MMVARLGEQSDRYLRAVEIAVYAAPGALLSATIALALGMLVEVLHTVRISRRPT
jgi:hypothetical protein